MLKAVIFDMDGLMINSEIVTFDCYKKVMGEMGLEIPLEFYVTLLGKPVTHAHERFHTVYGEDFPVEDVIKKVHLMLAETFQTQGVPLKPGLIELLTYLKENNYKTIVATSSNRARVDKILAGAKIAQYFDDSICGDEVTKGKPNPEIFLKACEKLGVEPSEALVLEDSEAGIQAAYSGNIKVICVLDMKYPDEQYKVMTTKIVDTLHEVIDYVKEA